MMISGVVDVLIAGILGPIIGIVVTFGMVFLFFLGKELIRRRNKGKNDT